MSYKVRYTGQARSDLKRHYRFLLAKDLAAAELALEKIRSAMKIFEELPFSCRKVESDDPFLRELIIPFGSSGYVALFDIGTDGYVTILALRHQREEDYL